MPFIESVPTTEYMIAVNQSSLRAEFDALKARFESLCAAGKMSAESRALFDALLMLFELLMAVFMEKHTPKSSANSSLPASQSPNDDTARTRTSTSSSRSTQRPSSIAARHSATMRSMFARPPSSSHSVASSSYSAMRASAMA